MNIFQLKANSHGIDRQAEFLKDNYVGIQWSKLGDLEKLSRDEFKDRLAAYYILQGQELENALEEINTFVYVMQDGDYVLLASDDWVYLGDLGDYYFVENSEAEEEDRCHRRGVTWLKSLPRTELSGVLLELLSQQGQVTKLEQPVSAEQIEYWLSPSPGVSSGAGDKVNVTNEMIEEALTILKLAMLSDDVERRERAAIAILGYAKP